jgi:hypothetical protein
MAQSSYWPKLVLGILIGFAATQAWLSWSAEEDRTQTPDRIWLPYSTEQLVALPGLRPIDWSVPNALSAAGWPSALGWADADWARQVERPDGLLAALLGKDHTLVQPLKPESVVWVDRHRFVAEWVARQDYAIESFYLLFEVDATRATGAVPLQAFASRRVLDDLSVSWLKQVPDALVWSQANGALHVAFVFSSWDVDNDPYTFQRAFAAELDLDSLLRALPDSNAAQFLQVVDSLVETDDRSQ